MKQYHVTIRQFITPETLEEIALRQGNAKNKERSFHGLTNVISRAKWQSDYFCVIAKSKSGRIVGSAGFIQSETDQRKWIYTDLWVDAKHRRKGIATHIVQVGLEHLSDINAKTLYCTVDPDNQASLSLQKSIGFSRIPTEPFNELCVDDLLMFQIKVPHNLNSIPLEPNQNHVAFICELLTSKQNAAALHTKKVAPNERNAFFHEMKAALQCIDPDEAHFIIRKGIVPVAWLKLNGLQGNGTAWISMLVVHETFQQQGIGSYAVRFAEDFIRSKGFHAVGIHTNVDNIAAQNLYKKLGYTITEQNECTNGDGEKRQGLTFYRDHLDAEELCVEYRF